MCAGNFYVRNKEFNEIENKKNALEAGNQIKSQIYQKIRIDFRTKKRIIIEIERRLIPIDDCLLDFRVELCLPLLILFGLI